MESKRLSMNGRNCAFAAAQSPRACAARMRRDTLIEVAPGNRKTVAVK